jgi:hypothetical protein
MKRFLILAVICLGFVATSKAQTPPVCTFAQVAFNSVNNTFEYHCPNTNQWFPATITGGGGGGTGNGLLDPGANGIVLRTAVDITTIATSADIIALFGGTCGPSSFLRGDGTCATVNAFTYPSAGIAVSAGTSGPWSASLQVGTAPNNLVQLNNSSQLPAVSAANLTNFPTLNQNTTGNAATATSLSATPVICGPNQAPRGIVTNGNSTGCQSIQASPAPATSIQYAAGTCTGGIPCVDTNDGVSWGTAKLSIDRALAALPGGIGKQAGKGTIFVGPGAVSNSAGAQYGIWLMGSKDPNFNTPPTGWMVCVQGGPACDVYIVGTPNDGFGPNTHKPKVGMNASGGGFDTHHPAVWISGTAGVWMSNLDFQYPGRGLVIGECSTGLRDGTCAVTNSTFENDAFLLNQLPGNGPCTDITGASFWLWFRDFGCGGNAVNASGGITANNAAAMLIDGTGNTGNGLIHVTDTSFAAGGIKFIPGPNGGGLYADNINEEGDFVHQMPPVVWFTSFPVQTDCKLSNIQLIDSASSTVVVENDGGGPGCTILNALGQITGANVVVSQDIRTLIQNSPNPRGQRQVGFFNGYEVGENDVARRIAGITPARFTNLATSFASGWTLSSAPGNTLTTGILDPFGGTSAGTISSTGAGGAVFLSPGSGSCTQAYTPTSGDWLITGGWVELSYVVTNPPINFNYCSFPTPTFSQTFSNLPITKPDGGSWSFVWTASKVSGGSATHLGSAASFSLGFPLTIYGPVLYIIPAGTISDNEVLEFVSSMNSVDTNCPAGSVCTIQGHPLVADTYGTILDCADPSSPAVCGASATGSIAVPAGANSTLTVGANRVTAKSQILLTIDASLGTRLSVTCNTTAATLVQPFVTSRTPGTGFTIEVPATTSVNPVCVSYMIIN